MADPNQNEDRPPLALAAEWLAKITTVVSEMVFPGMIGYWLDRRWGTNYLSLVGLVLGVPGGLYHLIRMTRNLK